MVIWSKNELASYPILISTKNVITAQNCMLFFQNTQFGLYIASNGWTTYATSPNNYYLSQRTQYVYNGVKYELYDISYGLPQGGVLGPLLFIIYSNDKPKAIMHNKTVLFADDISVYLLGQK